MRKIICPHCGAENYDHRRICIECGEPLPSKGGGRRGGSGAALVKLFAIVLGAALLIGGGIWGARRLIAGNGSNDPIRSANSGGGPATAAPAERSTAAPTATPTERPTATPMERPTAAPTATPTERPTATPTAMPTERSTAAPTATPTERPTAAPAVSPASRGSDTIVAPEGIATPRQLAAAVWQALQTGATTIELPGAAMDVNRAFESIVDTVCSISQWTLYSPQSESLSFSFDAGLAAYFALRDGTLDQLSGDERQVAEKARAVIASIIRPGMTDYEKELAIHDYIAGHCDYRIDPALFTGDARGVFLHGKAQCSGYADAFRLLGRLAGLDVVVIAGDAFDSSLVASESPNHAWNLVRLDGQWYMVDVTFDDSYDGGDAYHHGYLNVPLSLTTGNRRWNAEFLPEGPYAQTPDERYYFYPLAATQAEALRTALEGLDARGEVTVAWTGNQVNEEQLLNDIQDGYMSTHSGSQFTFGISDVLSVSGLTVRGYSVQVMGG